MKLWCLVQFFCWKKIPYFLQNKLKTFVCFLTKMWLNTKEASSKSESYLKGPELLSIYISSFEARACISFEIGWNPFQSLDVIYLGHLHEIFFLIRIEFKDWIVLYLHCYKTLYILGKILFSISTWYFWFIFKLHCTALMEMWK